MKLKRFDRSSFGYACGRTFLVGINAVETLILNKPMRTETMCNMHKICVFNHFVIKLSSVLTRYSDRMIKRGVERA